MRALIDPKDLTIIGRGPEPTKQEQKRFYMDFELYLRGKRKKVSVNASFVRPETDPDHDGLRPEDDKQYEKVAQAVREFGEYLKSVGELD